MNELSFAESELLLSLAMILSSSSTKDIAAATGIKASTLYKWRTTDVHLSAKKMDILLSYFAEEEPFILILAEIVKTVLLLLFIDSTSLTDKEVS